MAKKVKAPRTIRLARGLNVFATLIFIGGVFVLVAPLVMLVYYLMLILVALCTIFLLFLDEKFSSMFTKGEEVQQTLLDINKILPYFTGVALLFGVSSVLIYSLKKSADGKRYIAGLVYSSIILAFNIVVMVLSLTEATHILSFSM